MNALDELEALGDSMESLNSCCSTDEGVDQIQVQPSTAATNVAVSTPRSTRTAAPLLVSSDSDGESGDEAVSTCSFGSTADLSAVSSTPVPSWCEVCYKLLFENLISETKSHADTALILSYMYLYC